MRNAPSPIRPILPTLLVATLCLPILGACAEHVPATSSEIPTLAADGEPIIYGEDDRMDFYQVSDAILRQVADSTAILVYPSTVSPAEAGDGWDIDAFAYGSYGEYFGLCANEPFYAQPTPGVCSGFLVGDDLIATAGHCITTQADCNNTAFIFNFAMRTNATSYPLTADADDVYFCSEVLGAVNTNTLDYAVVRTDRPVVGGDYDRAPLPIRRDSDGATESDNAISAMVSVSYPSGIPVKIKGGPDAIPGLSIGGVNVKATYTNYFEVGTDVQAGSSGSVLVSFDQAGALYRVEGNLVRGNPDFYTDGSCERIAVCSYDAGCTGGQGDGWEEYNRTTSWDHLVPFPTVCGDSACEGAEDCASCPGDCGDCPPVYVAFSDDFSAGLNAWTISGGGWSTRDMHSTDGYPGAASSSPVANARNCKNGCTLTSGVFNLDGAVVGTTLDFLRFVDGGIDTGEYLRLDLYDGVNWSNVFDWTNNSGDTNVWEAESLTLPSAYLVNGFRFRFASDSDRKSEHTEIDDVVLTVETAASGCTTDADCDDSNACTADSCDTGSGACTNSDTSASCDDGNVCTVDSCDAALGCQNTAGNPGATCRVSVGACDAAETCTGASTACPDDGFAGAGTTCGSGATTECSGPDTCDGAGTCLTNDATAGATCGDAGDACTNQDTCDGSGACVDNGFPVAGTSCGATATECSDQDTCDGAGSCQANDFGAGTTCGDGATECSGQDTCDGAGSCQANDLAADAACGDTGTACTNQDTCDGSGACIDKGFPAAGEPCGDAATQCSGQDTCDGAGACLDNDLGTETACGSAGDECVSMGSCDGSGGCTAGLPMPNDTPCGSGATACSAQDTCDGAGACQPNDFGAGATCGDAGTECTNQDTCDGAGSCVDNGFPASGTACGDAATECSGQDTCDGAGSCQANDLATGESCGDTGTECTNQDTCDGSGACTDNGFPAAGESCGDAATECSGQDTCDGAGSCLGNDLGAGETCGSAGGECMSAGSCDGSGSCADSVPLPSGTTCGSAASVCSAQDTCDGDGACLANDFGVGTSCGDGATECSGQDTCDGAGSCEANDFAAGAICGDAGTECTNQDACDGAGSCVDNGYPASGTACGSAATECSGQDSCDGSGTCLVNDAAAGTACGDDGSACVNQDTCDGVGGCADNGFITAGTACGDGPTACSAQDSCDGAGACAINDLAAGAPCDDGNICTDDACDGGGSCASVPNSAPCDDGDACTTDDVCSGGSCAGTGSCGPTPPTAEVVALTGIGSGGWTTVSLSNSYTAMVVTCVPAYDGGTAPGVVRLTNADAGSSFDVRVDSAGGAAISGVDVTCFVIEAGVYTVADHGVKLEAVRYTSTVTDENNSWVGEARSYAHNYASPVVLGQVMTYNDPDFSHFWCRGAARNAPPSSTALWTGKTVDEDPDATRADETIGYVVFEAGSGTLGAFDYAAGLGSDSVRGVDNGAPNSYTTDTGFTIVVLGAVVTQAAMDGANGGWALLWGSGAVDGITLALGIDEDQYRDSERKHTTEQVGWVVFGQ